MPLHYRPAPGLQMGYSDSELDLVLGLARVNDISHEGWYQLGEDVMHNVSLDMLSCSVITCLWMNTEASYLSHEPQADLAIHQTIDSPDLPSSVAVPGHAYSVR